MAQPPKGSFAEAMRAELDAAVEDQRRAMNRVPVGFGPREPLSWHRRLRSRFRHELNESRERLARRIAPWLGGDD